MNGMSEWILERVKMIDEGCSLEQIQMDCWYYCQQKYSGIFTLDAMVCKSMELYVEIVKQSGV